jgi:hypothetical protein
MPLPGDPAECIAKAERRLNLATSEEACKPCTNVFGLIWPRVISAKTGLKPIIMTVLKNGEPLEGFEPPTC